MREKPQKTKSQKKPKMLKNQECQNEPKQPKRSELIEMPK